MRWAKCIFWKPLQKGGFPFLYLCPCAKLFLFSLFEPVIFQSCILRSNPSIRNWERGSSRASTRRLRMSFDSYVFFMQLHSQEEVAEPIRFVIAYFITSSKRSGDVLNLLFIDSHDYVAFLASAFLIPFHRRQLVTSYRVSRQASCCQELQVMTRRRQVTFLLSRVARLSRKKGGRTSRVSYFFSRPPDTHGYGHARKSPLLSRNKDSAQCTIFVINGWHSEFVSRLGNVSRRLLRAYVLQNLANIS